MDMQRPDIASVLKEARPKRRLARRVGWTVVAVLLIAGVVVWLGTGDSSSTVTYTAEPATVGNLTVTVTATGTVEPTNEVELSSELSGTIGSVDADFNDVVTKGQTLAMLKTDQLEANVALARATLAARKAEVQQAEATVAEKQAAFDRANELLAKKFGSTETFELAKADDDRATAGLAACQGQSGHRCRHLEHRRVQPQQGVHLLADRRRGSQPQRGGRPDRRVLSVGAGVVHARRESDADAAPGRYRRSRRRQDRQRPGSDVHR